jgi:hypothetical protein
VQGLKIFLHPSLVDTPLGCRVQELDRLVDTYALEQLPDRARITDQYYAQVAVYNVALAKRREAIAEKANWAELKQSAASILLKYGSMAGPGLRQYSLFADSSILRRKPEFFDPSLIKTAKSCQKPDLDGFETCVLETYRSSRAIREFKKDELNTWLIGPTEMEPWSGVRERKYRIGNDLDFLRQPAGNPVEDRLWPFDFIVQIAFTSAAVNLPEKQQEKYVDRQPIEFDEIQSKIENLVKAGIEKDGFGVQFEDLRSFAILQRLFRAALNGNLGSHFPILKLAELTDSTKGAAPYFHTKRWNTSATVRIEMLVRRAALLQNNPAPWMKKAALKLPRCESSLARTLADSRDQSDLADCQFEEFRDVAGAACPENADERSPGCIWRSVVAGTGALPRIQKVEVAFGVLDDERQNHGGVDCPPLAPPTYLSVKR